MSPGVLFSAIKQVPPHSVWALCTEQAKAGIIEALSHRVLASYHASLIMWDPFNSIDEINELLQKSREFLLHADAIQVNLTDTTAMMGIAVPRIYEQARNGQRVCQRLVLTDKRPPEE